MPALRRPLAALAAAALVLSCSSSSPDQPSKDAPAPSFTVEWTRSAPLAFGASPAVSDDRIYYFHADRSLRIAALADGKDLATEPHPEWHRPVFLAAAEGLYVATQIAELPLPADGSAPRIRGQEILKLGPGGALLWKSGLPQPLAGAPSLERDALYVSTTAGVTYRLPRQGAPALQAIPHGRQVASRVAEVNDELCFGTRDGELVWVRIADGKLSQRLTGFDIVTAGPVPADGAVFFGTAANFLYRAEQGDVSWRFRTAADIQDGLLLAGDRILFASRDSFVYALEARQGGVVWRTRVPNRVLFPPHLWGKFIAVTVWNDPRVYLLDAASGRQVSTYARSTEAAPVAVPPLLAGTRLVVWNGDEVSCLTLR